MYNEIPEVSNMFNILLDNEKSCIKCGQILSSQSQNYNVVTLLGSHVTDYPTFVSVNSSSIIIEAHKGLIQSFQLSNLAFRYLSQSITLSGNVDASYANFLFSYYIVFLFVTPIAIVILLSRGFREDKLEQE